MDQPSPRWTARGWAGYDLPTDGNRWELGFPGDRRKVLEIAMGGFAFVFGFLLTCFGLVLMSSAGMNELVANIGFAITISGAIVCGSGVIGHAIEGLGRRARTLEAPPKGDDND